MKIDISEYTLPDDFHETSDFYLPEENPGLGLIYPNARELVNLPEYYDIALCLVNEAKKSLTREFALDLLHDGERIIIRGHSIDSVEGKIFIFRRLPSYIPKITEIGMPQPIIEVLLHERLNQGGLVIIAGETGQGKSTTAGATISHRLSHFGSFCLTIENPVELPLQGYYPNERDSSKQGVCFQTEVQDLNILEAIKSSLRCYPSISNSILFLGEIRDGAMAAEALRIAANGHLVITTMHAGDLKTALMRFMGLATSGSGMNDPEARALFASVFRLLIHQTMDRLPNGKRKLRPQVLFSPSSSSSVASRLKNGNIDMLSTEIDAQKTILQKGQSLFQNTDRDR